MILLLNATLYYSLCSCRSIHHLSQDYIILACDPGTVSFSEVDERNKESPRLRPFPSLIVFSLYIMEIIGL